jgi:hypothetical protein
MRPLWPRPVRLCSSGRVECLGSALPVSLPLVDRANAAKRELDEAEGNVHQLNKTQRTPSKNARPL